MLHAQVYQGRGLPGATWDVPRATIVGESTDEVNASLFQTIPVYDIEEGVRDVQTMFSVQDLGPSLHVSLHVRQQGGLDRLINISTDTCGVRNTFRRTVILIDQNNSQSALPVSNSTHNQTVPFSAQTHEIIQTRGVSLNG